ncbi:hypothetical protein GCM10009085_32540 [Pseudomonas avellanae]|nr:hypothetical protein GCM10009085_32540 [Pseudomonas avellanae]
MHVYRNPCVPGTAYFDATLFLRHSRMLRAIFTDTQAWFCLADLAPADGQGAGPARHAQA